MKYETNPYSRFIRIDKHGNIIPRFNSIKLPNSTEVSIDPPEIHKSYVIITDDNMERMEIGKLQLLADSYYGKTCVAPLCNPNHLHADKIHFEPNVLIHENGMYIINGEEYKPIPGFCSYFVNKYGAVYSSRTSRFMRQKSDRPDGYKMIQIVGDDGIPKYRKIHRIVFEVWLDAIPNMMVVNHINCNTGCNFMTNLELCSSFQNTRHANIHHLKDDAWDIPSVYKICNMMSRGASIDHIFNELGDVGKSRTAVLSLCYRISTGEVYRDISSQFDIDFSIYKKSKASISESDVIAVCEEIINGGWLRKNLHAHEIDEQLGEKFGISKFVIRSIRLQSKWKRITSKYDFR